MAKEKFKLKNIPQKVKDASAFISAVIAIGAVLLGAGQWIVHEVTASTNNRVDILEQKIDDNQQTNELATTRLELMMLLDHDPDNVIEIEKLARKYFNPPLNGNTYMTSVISEWCLEHNIDCGTIILK